MADVLHTEPRVIAGVLREALLSGREVLLQSGNQKIWTHIVDIAETSQRSKVDPRAFKVKHSVTVVGSEGILITIPFGRFIFTGTVHANEGLNSYGFPLELKQQTQRKFERFQLSTKTGWSKVAIVKDEATVVCEFAVEEYSHDSFRGLLNVPAGQQLNSQTYVFGKIETEAGGIQIDGRIQRSTEILGGDEQVYRIVVSRNFTPKSTQEMDESTSDRRSQKRASADLKLVLVSDVLRCKIALNVTDLSIASFRASLPNELEISHVVFGIDYFIEGAEIAFHLISRRDEELIFGVTDGSEKGRKWWFQQYSKALQPSLHTGSVNSEDVLRLFCEAGAFSTNYLKGSKKGIDAFQSGIENLTEKETWLHRWIEQGAGRTVGYISAVRLARKVWGIVDIAGSQDPSNKMSRNFVHNFLYAFSRFLIQFHRQSNILIIWVDKHPFWDKLENQIVVQPNLVRSSGKLNYSRVTGEADLLLVKPDPDVICRNIADSNISKMLSEYRDINSPVLKILMDPGDDVVSMQHRRLLFEIENRKLKIRFIAAVIEMPEGSTISRVAQSLFLYPTSSFENDAGWSSIRKMALGHCYKNGYFPSSIRRLLNGKMESLLEGEQAVMRIVCLQPEILGGYENST